jgi:ABC-type sugar transport system ATPase subunit
VAVPGLTEAGRAEGATGLVLQARGLTKTYPGARALVDADLDLAPGEVRALLGRNGAGKSTLVKILGGVVGPDAGSIALDGAPVELHSPSEARARGVATVHQELSLVPGLTVAENVMLGRWPERRRLGVRLVDRDAIRAQAREALAQLGRPLDLDAPVRRLSMADRQIVEIVKAWSTRPRVLILDEPSSSLPAHEVDALLDLVRRVSAEGVAVVYVSHRMQEIPAVAHTVTVLRDGRVVATLPVEEAGVRRLSQLMTGGELAERDARPARRRPPGETVLRVRHLADGGKLRDVSFDLRRGEVLGVAGLLGSGRTELLRAVVGLERPVAGDLEVHGRRVWPPDPRTMRGLGVGLVPEDRKGEGAVLDLSVEENLAMACLPRVSRLGVLSTSARARVAEESIARLDIVPPAREALARGLSGGNQQKVVIAKWLNAQVDVLLMDEPTRGIDIHAKEQIYELIGELVDQGLGIVVVSSELEELLALCDRILALRDGRIVAEVRPDETTLADVLALAMGEVAEP